MPVGKKDRTASRKGAKTAGAAKAGTTRPASDLADSVVAKLLCALDRRYRRQRGLRTALKSVIADIYWMSAASDFAPGGLAHKGWEKVRARTNRASRLLAKAA